LKIKDIHTISFRYKSRIIKDEEGHSHPGPEHGAVMTLTKIVTDEGTEGYCFGGSKEANRLLKKILVGEDPMDREKIWQKMSKSRWLYREILTDRAIATIDLALWDLAGRYLNLPVYKLLGGCREKVLAYASTMCGDNIPGGLNTPEAYADFAEKCKKEGYKAFKIHPWMPPYDTDPKKVVATCKAVRERVGDEMILMLDPYHFYSREEALYIGKEIEKLNFYWYEQPMNEYSISSYTWLVNQLNIPLIGPEMIEGNMWIRAEWILRGACDICRCDVYRGLGVTGLMKVVHLCESFGISMEVHVIPPWWGGGGAGNLQVLGAMGIPGRFWERGLLHPLLNYEEQTPWLKEIIDPMDSEGYVHIPQKPGLGFDINWNFIQENIIEET